MATIPSPYASSALESSHGARDVTSAPGWHLATRIAFRFCFLYFGLYVVTTQTLKAFLDTPGFDLPDLGVLPPLRPLFLWIGTHLLGVAPPTSRPTTGTGDTLFGWIQTFSLLLIATVATVIWSVIARRRTEHARLFAWFRLFLRIAVGVTFLAYYGGVRDWRTYGQRSCSSSGSRRLRDARSVTPSTCVQSSCSSWVSGIVPPFQLNLGVL
jgi:hypothetical protein